MLFYSPHPNPLQQERELRPAVTHCFIISKSCADTYARRHRNFRLSHHFRNTVSEQCIIFVTLQNITKSGLFTLRICRFE